MSRPLAKARLLQALRRSALLALIATPLFATGAAAQPTSAQQAAIKSSCQSDFRANCAGVSPGGSAALQCLQKNVAKLSAGCQQAVNAVSGPPAAPAAPAATAPAATAPAATAPATAAPAAPPAKTPAKAPAKAPAAAAPPPPPPPPPMQLSPRQEAMIVRQYCGRDFNRFCSNVRLGGGNGVACLRANATRLSAGCKQALAAAMR